MTEQEAAENIAALLEVSKNAIETALNLGREHNVPVRLTQLGITEDMWYVDEAEYRQEYIMDNFGQYDSTSGDYVLDEELTPEELQEVEEHMASLRENNGYDGNNYKVLGWMSSSTNC